MKEAVKSKKATSSDKSDEVRKGKNNTENRRDGEKMSYNEKNVSDNIKPCDKCEKDIFFAKNSNGRWMPFDAELSEVVPPNNVYCDGYGKVKRTGEKPGKKGYIVHFGSCK